MTRKAKEAKDEAETEYPDFEDEGDDLNNDSRRLIDAEWRTKKRSMFDFRGHSVFWRHSSNDNPVVKVAQDFIDSLFWQIVENHYQFPESPSENAGDADFDTWHNACKRLARWAIREIDYQWDEGDWGEFLRILDKALSIMGSNGSGDARPYLAAHLTPSGQKWFEDSLETFSEFTYNDKSSKHAHFFAWKLRPLREAVKELRDQLNIHATLLATNGAENGLQFDGEAVKRLFDSPRTIAQIMDEATNKIVGMVNKARKRGRPARPGGPRKYTPNERRLRAAICIVETMRSGKASTIRGAIAYCVTHGEDACRDFDDDGSMLKRWAGYNRTTVTNLFGLSDAEWEKKKDELK